MIRVGIVDDHPVFRQGLAHAIEASGELELVIAAASLEELVSKAGSDTIDVVVLDLGLPGVRGADAVNYLCGQQIVVLVVSAAGGQRDVLDAVGAGASGYLTKSAEPDEITTAVVIVARGGTYVSPTLASFLLRATRRDETDGPFALTRREKEILALVASGERDAEIAEELFISIATVRSHLDRIRDKTGRRRRADLTRLAIEQGIVDNDAQGGEGDRG
jgi:DNA-binding NarL/FixJ family response regulator